MPLPIAIIFPGQGSQYIGMGADFRRMSPSVEAIYQLADAATGLPIGRVSSIGPDEHLTDTRFAQPAVVATSLAALAILKCGRDRCARRLRRARPDRGSGLCAVAWCVHGRGVRPDERRHGRDHRHL